MPLGTVSQAAGKEPFQQGPGTQQAQAHSSLSKVAIPVPTLVRPNKLLTPASIFLKLWLG